MVTCEIAWQNNIQCKYYVHLDRCFFDQFGSLPHGSQKVFMYRGIDPGGGGGGGQ